MMTGSGENNDNVCSSSVSPKSSPSRAMLPKPPGFGFGAKDLNIKHSNSPPPASKLPPPPPPRGYRRQKKSRGCCCRLCLCCTCFLFILIALIAIVGGISYLVLSPKKPTFAIEEIKLATFNVTRSSALASKVLIGVKTTNPNKKIGFEYGETVVKVSYDGRGDFIPLGSDAFPPFLHKKGNTTVLKFDLKSVNAALSKDTIKHLEAAREKDSLPLQVELDTTVGVVISNASSKKIRVTLLCSNVDASFTSSSARTTDNDRCKIRFFGMDNLWFKLY